MDAIPTLAGPERMPPLTEAEMTPEQLASVKLLMSGPRSDIRGPWVPLLRSPGFMDRVQKVGEYIRWECGLPANLRELAILVAAVYWKQTTEWLLHVEIALKAGVDRAALEDMAAERAPKGLTAEEQAVYDFCLELHTTHAVSDANYDRVLKQLGDEGVVQLAGLCGYYTTLAMIMNVARTQIPEEDAPFAVP